jgi:hypothetical protein
MTTQRVQAISECSCGQAECVWVCFVDRGGCAGQPVSNPAVPTRVWLCVVVCVYVCVVYIGAVATSRAGSRAPMGQRMSLREMTWRGRRKSCLSVLQLTQVSAPGPPLLPSLPRWTLHCPSHQQRVRHFCPWCWRLMARK